MDLIGRLTYFLNYGVIILDYRAVLKYVRRLKKITVSVMADQMDEKIHPAAYSRVENETGHLSLEQYFDICRVLGLNGEAVWVEANRINDIEELDINRILSVSMDWFSLEVQDDSMTNGPKFSIYPGSVIWYQSTNEASSNSLVVIEDESGKKYIRELISDLGRDTLRSWNSAYDNFALQHPFKVVGIVKDINYRM